MCRKKKLIVYLPNFGSGGAEKVLLNFIKSMSYKVDIVLMCSTIQGEYEIPAKVKVINLNTGGNFISLPLIIYHLIKNKYDAILTTMSAPNIIFIIAGMITSTRCIIREANTPSREYNHSLLQYLLYIIKKLLYPYATGIIAISDGVRNDLTRFLKIPTKKIRRIYSPLLEPSVFNMINEEIHLNLFNNLNKYVCAVGRISPQKDYLTLLKAFKLVMSNQECHLVIVGRIDDRNYFNTLVSFINNNQLDNNVHFIGFLQNPYSIINKANVFVLSSKYEGLPGVLVYALAMNKPIVSTNCESGPKEILKNGEYGALVNVGDFLKMADYIINILNGTKFKKPTKKYLEIYDIEYASKKYLEYIFG